jgi:hypothetical protein
MTIEPVQERAFRSEITTEGNIAVDAPGPGWCATTTRRSSCAGSVGLTDGNMVEVMEGLAPGDRVATKGSLFIDRVAPAET